MRTTMMILCALIVGCASSLDGKGLWKTKADTDLQLVVDRYQAAAIDTTITVMVIPSRMWNDAERADIAGTCELILADRLDSVVMVRCVSRSIPCLGSLELVEGLLLSPPWSPDL